jgi:hypothetical protein
VNQRLTNTGSSSGAHRSNPITSSSNLVESRYFDVICEDAANIGNVTASVGKNLASASVNH